MKVLGSMENFVTIFDSNFMPQGLALHSSMMRHIKSFCLWIICVDESCHRLLKSLQLPNVKLIPLADVETDELKAVKGHRTTGEYCWTLTPFSPSFVFLKDPDVLRVTYIDADLWFRGPPDEMIDEFLESRKSVLITEHAFAPEYDQSTTSGKYCVQFITFERVKSAKVIDWWQKACIDWCFSRVEDGKFGDQKYLDLWPMLFKDHVHILSNKELILAPWNATRYPITNSLVWHFHQFRIVKMSGLGLIFHYGTYYLPKVVRKEIYGSYTRDVRSSIKALTDVGWVLKGQKKLSLFDYLKTYIAILFPMLSANIQVDKCK